MDQRSERRGAHTNRVLGLPYRGSNHSHIGFINVCVFHDSRMVVLRRKAAEYLLGTKVIRPYRWLWVIAVLVGSVLSLSTVWSLADVTNGLMAIPNLISLIALNGVVVDETRRYLWSNNLNETAPPATELADA